MFRPTARATLIAALTAAFATLASASTAGASYVRIDPRDFFVATVIGAFFGALPPSARGSSYVRFQVYRSKPIPTDLELPCSGSAQVTFVPLPLLPPARTIGVPVKFVGQP